jgi:ABC-type uncharacterized transport system ATPase subunit
MCNFENCTKRASFNYKNEKKSIYCSNHKLDGMINICTKICTYPECKTVANFNYENEKKKIIL